MTSTVGSSIVRVAQRELAADETIGDAIDTFELWPVSTGAKRVTVRTARERLDHFFAGEETDACAAARLCAPVRCTTVCASGTRCRRIGTGWPRRNGSRAGAPDPASTPAQARGPGSRLHRPAVPGRDRHAVH
jgi:hypothetical protein